MFEKFPLLLLAAGKSTRTKVPKGVIPFNGMPWLEQQLNLFKEVGGKRLAIVLGFHRAQYLNSMPWLVEADERWLAWKGLEVSQVTNPKPDDGQFSSLLCGMKWLKDQNPPATFLIPLDVPFPKRSVWAALAFRLEEKIDVCQPTFDGKGGHPVLLSPRFIHHLLSVSPQSSDGRLDKQIERLDPARVARVTVDDCGILKNMNSEAEFLPHSPGYLT